MSIVVRQPQLSLQMPPASYFWITGHQTTFLLLAVCILTKAIYKLMSHLQNMCSSFGLVETSLHRNSLLFPLSVKTVALDCLPVKTENMDLIQIVTPMYVMKSEPKINDSMYKLHSCLHALENDTTYTFFLK